MAAEQPEIARVAVSGPGAEPLEPRTPPIREDGEFPTASKVALKILAGDVGGLLEPAFAGG